MSYHELFQLDIKIRAISPGMDESKYLQLFIEALIRRWQGHCLASVVVGDPLNFLMVCGN